MNINTETNIMTTTPKNAKKITEKRSFYNPKSKKGNTNTNNEQKCLTVPNNSKTIKNNQENQTPKKGTIAINLNKKLPWNHNITQSTNIMNAFVNEQQNKLKSNLQFVFGKLSELSNIPFFQNLQSIKKQTNELLSLISKHQINSCSSTQYFDYGKIFLDYIEGVTQQFEDQNKKNNDYVDPPTYLNKSPSPSRINSNLLNYSQADREINYLFTKENSVSFEIPILRKRALSSRVEQRLQRSRKSSEEIEKRIKEKMATAEKKKESIKQFNIENSNKINEKISEIKQRQKKEKKEKIKKIYTKLEKMNNQQQKIMERKIEMIRKEHEKVNEINYLHRLEKENKDFNILKKLDISIERRNKYLQEKINRTLHHRRYMTNSINNSMSSGDTLQENLINKLDQSSSNGLEALERKKMVENRIEFLKKVFNENFIWELFEADYFNVEELYNLSSLTRFELLKSKLKKEKEVIDKLFDQKNQSSQHHSNNITNTITTSNWNETVSNEQDGLYNEDEIFNSKDEEENNGERRSKSFTMFNEDDFNDVNYLFINESKKRKNRKKRKKTNVDNKNSGTGSEEKDEESRIKNKLIRTINSLSQTDLRVFYDKVSKDNKMKQFLVKSKSNGKYVQSKLIITQEIVSNNNSNQQDTTANTTNNQSSISTPKKDQNLNKSLGNTTTNANSNLNLNSNAQSTSQKSDNPQTTPPNSTNEKGITFNNSNSNININSNKESTLMSEQDKQTKEKKEKIFHNLIQVSDLSTNSNNNTIMINSDSLANILEKNQITVRWCKICNMILPNDQDSNVHISKPEHQKIKKEYGLSIQEESNTIMVFQSIPGDINEELKNERVNAIKLRVKKLKQKMSLKAVKHENFWCYKQDLPSVNKQRIQKLSFDVEKQVFPNIKDYDTLENLLKDLIKLLDQKKQNDLHILRQVKLIHCLVEVLKKPAACHKSEIKSLGKIIELIIKILTIFSTLLENRNYMIVTNRISVIADLLLWVLNKPTKIPLGISFLPDLISIITIHIKHRITFEYLYMKDDTLEYLFLSNIPIKFKQKYYNLNGPIDLSSGFGSFPLVLLQSLGMFESLTKQININYLTKPVYVKHTKMNENILFMLEYSELIGVVHLLSVLLLSNGPIKLKEKVAVQSQTVISASLLAVKILNNICRIDLNLVQNIMSSQLNQEQIQHVISYIISYSLEYLETSDGIKELLHELLLLISYLALNNENFQNVVNKGEITIIQHICSLPFSYFSDKQLKDILFPTLITMTYNNERNTQILAKEINLEFIVMYLKEKIQLEPILEEDVDDVSSSINNEGGNINLVKINKEQFLSGNSDKNDIKPRGKAYSTASSTKSCHDMVTGMSDFILLNHRFPFELWEKAQEYYANFGKIK